MQVHVSVLIHVSVLCNYDSRSVSNSLAASVPAAPAEHHQLAVHDLPQGNDSMSEGKQSECITLYSDRCRGFE